MLIDDLAENGLDADDELHREIAKAVERRLIKYYVPTAQRLVNKLKPVVLTTTSTFSLSLPSSAL